MPQRSIQSYTRGARRRKVGDVAGPRDAAGAAAAAEWVAPYRRFRNLRNVDALAVRDGVPVIAVETAFHAPRARPYFALARVLFD